MLRLPVERWTRPESEANIASAPRFSQPAPPREQLNALVAGYARITGDPVRRPAKRNLVASGYRVHGEDFLPLVEDLFHATGSATNLLGEVRCMPPRHRAPGQSRPASIGPVDAAAATVPDVETASVAPLDCGCDVAVLIPGLIYCHAHRPTFAGNDPRRHDRRRSNPEAERHFTIPDGARTGRLEVPR